jgi:hypothetical protein
LEIHDFSHRPTLIGSRGRRCGGAIPVLLQPYPNKLGLALTRVGKELATFAVAAGRLGGGNPAAMVQLQGSA